MNDLRDAITSQWQHYHSSGQLQADLDSMKPSDRAALMVKLAQFVAPKLKSVDIDIVQNTTVTIEQRLLDMVNPDESPCG